MTTEQIVYVVAALFGVVGIAMIIVNGPQLDKMLGTPWTTTPGKILESRVIRRKPEIRPNDSDVDDEEIEIRFEYAYFTENKAYIGHQIRFGQLSRPTEAQVYAYPQDSSVTVYFDPGNPQSAFLQKPSPVRFVVLAVMGALLVLGSMGAAALAYLTR